MKLAKEGEETIGSHRMEDDVVEKKGCYQLGRGKTGEVRAAIAVVANQFSRGSHCPRSDRTEGRSAIWKHRVPLWRLENCIMCVSFDCRSSG
jgi:hypothetical protein